MASEKFDLEAQNGNNWEKLIEVDNFKRFRRLVIPVKEVQTNALRIVFKEKNISGGLAEVRVYNESQKAIESIKRANKTMNEPDEKVLLPWEK